MSSSSSLSDFSPRIRGRRYPHTSLLNRNTYNRMWLKKTFKEELAIFYSRQAEGFPFVPFYLRNTVYSNLLEQQHAIYLEHCDPRKMNKRSARESTLKKTTLNSDIEVNNAVLFFFNHQQHYNTFFFLKKTGDKYGTNNT